MKGCAPYGIFAHRPIAARIMDALPIISQMAMFRAMPELRVLLHPWRICERMLQRLRAVLVRAFVAADENNQGLAHCMGEAYVTRTREHQEIQAQCCIDACGCIALGGGALLSALWECPLSGAPIPVADVNYFNNSRGSTSWKAFLNTFGLALHESIADRSHYEFGALMTDALALPGASFVEHGCYFRVFGIQSLSVHAFIRDCTDLAFLRNFWNGQTLTVIRPFSVLRRHSVLDVSIHCIPTCWNHYHEHGDAVSARLYQWMERGFTIEPFCSLSDAEIAARLPTIPEDAWFEGGDTPDSSEEEALKDDALRQWDAKIYEPVRRFQMGWE